jgi:hypothetical protein
MEINIAYYRRKDWKKLLELIADRESMHDTWNEWNKSYLKTKLEFTNNGFIVNDIIVDLRELKKYCSTRDMKIDGKARSQFVSNRF